MDSVLFRFLVAAGAVVGGFLMGNSLGRLSYGCVGAVVGLIGALLPQHPRHSTN